MAYTSHGHHIPGSTNNPDLPFKIELCGGQETCEKCRLESVIYTRYNRTTTNEDRQFVAKRLVHQYLTIRVDGLRERFPTFPLVFSPTEIRLVWFAKTLQNWKACLCTPWSDSFYFEVTYDGDRDTAYLDCYEKTENVEIRNIAGGF